MSKTSMKENTETNELILNDKYIEDHIKHLQSILDEEVFNNLKNHLK